MNWSNTLTELLQVTYPIVQAPMLGVTSPSMVAAVSNEGGLGSLPVGGLSPQKTQALIQQTKALTNRPFAVNLFAHAIPPIDFQKAEAMQHFLQNLGRRYNLSFEPISLEKLELYSYKEQIDILLQEQIPIVSFTFGIPDEGSLVRLKQKRVILIGTATSVKEAHLLHQAGIDVITAQGIEAGGHRGSFLDEEPLPGVALLPLLSLLIDAVPKPILAAGGIWNGHLIKASLQLGAAGVQVGSAFLASEESVAIPAYKQLLAKSTDTDSVLTRTFSGRWARGIKNTFMGEVESSGLSIPDYPIQNSLTTLLRVAAQRQNNKDFTTLWAGQSASKAEAKPTAAIFRQLVEQAENLS